MPVKPSFLNKELSGNNFDVLIPNPKFELRYPQSTSNFTLATAKFIIAEFENVNVSYHGDSTKAVWLIEEWCRLNDFKFEVVVNDSGAVKITKIKTE